MTSSRLVLCKGQATGPCYAWGSVVKDFEFWLTSLLVVVKIQNLGQHPLPLTILGVPTVQPVIRSLPFPLGLQHILLLKMHKSSLCHCSLWLFWSTYGTYCFTSWWSTVYRWSGLRPQKDMCIHSSHCMISLLLNNACRWSGSPSFFKIIIMHWCHTCFLME